MIILNCMITIAHLIYVWPSCTRNHMVDNHDYTANKKYIHMQVTGVDLDF